MSPSIVMLSLFMMSRSLKLELELDPFCRGPFAGDRFVAPALRVGLLFWE